MIRLAKHPPVPLALTAFIVFLGACATISEETCQSGDWFSIGAADGAKGREPDFLDNHAQACAGTGVTPDRAAWEAGRRQGLRTYCTPEVVYAEGRRGRQLSPVCPAENLEFLTRSHETGREYWRIQQRIERLEREIRRMDRRLAQPGINRSSDLLDRMSKRNTIQFLRAEQRKYDRPPSS